MASYTIGGDGSNIFSALTPSSKTLSSRLGSIDSSPRRTIRKLPPILDQLMLNQKIVDTHTTSLGVDPATQYFFKSITPSGSFEFRLGGGVTVSLHDYCKGVDSERRPNNTLKVILGPDQSFFAWDELTIPW
jgi:hypothetical protein